MWVTPFILHMSPSASIWRCKPRVARYHKRESRQWIHSWSHTDMAWFSLWTPSACNFSLKVSKQWLLMGFPGACSWHIELRCCDKSFSRLMKRSRKQDCLFAQPYDQAVPRSSGIMCQSTEVEKCILFAWASETYLINTHVVFSDCIQIAPYPESARF